MSVPSHGLISSPELGVSRFQGHPVSDAGKVCALSSLRFRISDFRQQVFQLGFGFFDLPGFQLTDGDGGFDQVAGF